MIDVGSLQAGALVRLRFSYGEDLEDAVFCGLVHTENLSAARFAQANPMGEGLFTFDAAIGNGWLTTHTGVVVEVAELVEFFELGT